MSPRPSKPTKRASGAAKHAGGRPPKDPEERLSTQLGVRLGPEDTARLDRVTEKVPGGLVTRAAVARRAMTLGLELLEREPSRLFNDDFDEL